MEPPVARATRSFTLPFGAQRALSRSSSSSFEPVHSPWEVVVPTIYEPRPPFADLFHSKSRSTLSVRDLGGLQIVELDVWWSEDLPVHPSLPFDLCVLHRNSDRGISGLVMHDVRSISCPQIERWGEGKATPCTFFSYGPCYSLAPAVV